jgi:hypothetical protein
MRGFETRFVGGPLDGQTRLTGRSAEYRVPVVRGGDEYRVSDPIVPRYETATYELCPYVKPGESVGRNCYVYKPLLDHKAFEQSEKAEA